MRKFTNAILMVALVFLVGCESLPFMEAKAQIDEVFQAYAAGPYEVIVKYRDNPVYSQKWICTTDGKKLTGCHKAPIAPPVDTAPVVPAP